MSGILNKLIMFHQEMTTCTHVCPRVKISTVVNTWNIIWSLLNKLLLYFILRL